MMKKMMLLVSFCVIGLSAQAMPSATEMKANYDACVAAKPSWYNSWGRYVIAFDHSEAAQTCSEAGMMSRITGCKLDGSFAYAGYYCEGPAY